MKSGLPHLLNLLYRHQVKVRFILVGVWNTVFGYALFCILDTVFTSMAAAGCLAYMPALVISNVLAVMNAFVWHKYVTFRSAVRGLAMVTEFMRFSLTYAFSFCLSLILMPVSVEMLHVGTKQAAGMIIIICTVLSYLGHEHFSFRHRRRVPPGG